MALRFEDASKRIVEHHRQATMWKDFVLDSAELTAIPSPSSITIWPWADWQAVDHLTSALVHSNPGVEAMES